MSEYKQINLIMSSEDVELVEQLAHHFDTYFGDIISKGIHIVAAAREARISGLPDIVFTNRDGDPAMQLDMNWEPWQ